MTLNTSVKELVDTPPVDPKKLKKVYDYRNKYKIVKTEVHGVKIRNKKISLNPFFKQLQRVDERIVNSWNVFKEKDIQELEDMSKFVKEVNKIMDKYLMDAGRFGYLIEVIQKKTFVSEIEKVENEFICYLKGEISESNRFISKSKQMDFNDLDAPQKVSFSAKLLKSKEDLVKSSVNV